MKLRDLILDNLEISASQFCKEVGISRTTYESIMNGTNGYQKKSGEYKPSLIVVKKICNYFNTNFKNYI